MAVKTICSYRSVFIYANGSTITETVTNVKSKAKRTADIFT